MHSNEIDTALTGLPGVPGVDLMNDKAEKSRGNARA